MVLPGEFCKIPPSLETLVDLLNRDQRTILTVTRYHRDVKNNVRLTRSGNDDDDDDYIKNINNGFYRKNSNGNNLGPRRRFAPNKMLSRLGEVFIVGVCLLTIALIPTVMSAPSTRHAKEIEKSHTNEPTENTKNHVHPCWMSPEQAMNNSYIKKTSNDTNPYIIRNIIIVAKNALAYAEGFREKYVEETFLLPFEKHHDHLKNQKYDWLPNEWNVIPKRLGKKLDPVHLTNKTLDKFLRDIYEHMERLEVALEQVVIDQKKRKGSFSEDFRSMEFLLRRVLCELREGMWERNIVLRNHTPRSIMSDDIRKPQTNSLMNVRDWLIFRDLMNCLEYAIEVFTYIENQTNQNEPSSSSLSSSSTSSSSS